MTGFGVGDAALAGGRVVAEIRSVNHRFLDVRARLPRELSDLTLFAEQAARERLRRGRFELNVRTEGSGIAASALDKPRARAAWRALIELRDELAPGADVPLTLLGAVPELFVPAAGQELEAVRTAIQRAIGAAITAMDRMCRAEGASLAYDLLGRTAAFKALLRDVTALADSAREGFARRLRERLDRLLTGTSATLDAGRLEVEVVLLAERSDVTEEITRLASHLEQVSGLLAQGSARKGPAAGEPDVGSGPGGDGAGSARASADVEPVGRQLDFLLQEMVREVNTLGAKAQDAAISHIVVAMKVELERMREQVQNVE